MSATLQIGLDFLKSGHRSFSSCLGLPHTVTFLFLLSLCFMCRFRQTKSKKEETQDLFGFDQEENSSTRTDGSSTYKIKYFGFDDMSDSDGAEDDNVHSSKPRQRAKISDVSAVPLLGPVDERSADIPDPFERLQSQEKPPMRESKRHPEKRGGRIAGECTRSFGTGTCGGRGAGLVNIKP